MRRGAVLYDFLQVKGGAEYVTLLLAKEFPNLDVYIGSYDHSIFTSSEVGDIRSLESSSTSRWAPWRALKTTRVFEKRTKFLSRYDWVLYSGMYAPLAVINHPGKHILYCHTTPLPFAYDWQTYYLDRCPRWQRPAFRTLVSYLKPRYAVAVKRMDLLIANSDFVRRKYLEHFDKDSIVIYPPCDIEDFRWLGQQDYYLSTARLEPHKRVDVVVKAFLRMPHRTLVVASQGSELAYLQQLAEGAANICFVSCATRECLRSLIGQSIATIYIAKDEHFGITPVESMAAGKPVIGVAEGGLLETILPDETGLLLPPNPYVEDIVQAVQRLTPQRALEMRRACEVRAKLFGKEIFLEKMRSIIG